jgi:hypothetical protein
VPASEPDLILRANRVAPEMDIVLHFHGYSDDQARMRLTNKEASSGLDFCNPDSPSEPGRTRPTLGLLPRGKPSGGRSYTFPQLLLPGAIDALVTLGLAQVAPRGAPIRRGRFILTGHSGGGEPVDRAIHLLGEQLSEVHVFDGLYGPSRWTIWWAHYRIARDAKALRNILQSGGGRAEIERYMRARGSALRVIHRTGDPPRNTEPSSGALACAIAAELRLARDVAAWLRPYYRVEATRVRHNAIPRFFGFRLLRDASGDVPNTFLPVRSCARPPSRRPGPPGRRPEGP